MAIGGLLNGKALNKSNSLGTVVSTTSTITDNNNSTSSSLGSYGNSDYLVWYKFATPYNIDGYAVNINSYVNVRVKFYDENKNILRIETFSNTSGAFSIAVVNNVFYVSIENNANDIKTLYEFDVFGTKPITNKYLFKDGEEIKKYASVTTEIETGNYLANSVTRVGGSASASAQADSTYTAAKAFNGQVGSGSTDGWIPGWSTQTGWLQFKFNSPQRIEKYILRTNSGSPQITNSKTWTLLGSNDGVSWSEPLDAQTNLIWPDLYNLTIEFTNPNAYQYYRLNVTANAGGSCSSHDVFFIRWIQNNRNKRYD